MSILDPKTASFSGSVPVLVVGGGGCGLSAALSAKEHGAEVLVLERDASALGTTSMSTGLIPGPGSRFQREKGIIDTPEMFVADVMAKTKGHTDRDFVTMLAREGAPTVEWLVDSQKVPLSLIDSFQYPGHSAMRMHGSPNRTGSELMGALHHAIERAGIDILLEALVTDLFADKTGRIHGVRLQRPDGRHEDVGCDALILACCGFAGSREMLTKYIPEILDATFFGHPGNKGDAIRWGTALGAAVADIGAYQGHGGLAYGRGIPILWAHIIRGGFQVNARGERFSNESRGYSEQAVDIVAQPDRWVYSIFDESIHDAMKEFDDYQDAIKAGCILSARDVDDLARLTGLPAATLKATMADVEACVRGQKKDQFGRDFTKGKVLAAPFRAVKVNGALFHTQGGLVVDHEARVLRPDKSAFPNLFAGGGAARGISGNSNYGYLAGNGLLAATALGRLAGRAAARMVK
ncbi:MAG: FAD-dependent oxidoreductase [Alphaproteobacteria bacterium]|nr:FAD-dependent oxidoreductase [Alphaproteobacteria bacterium]